MKFENTFGETIKSLREKRCLSLREVANQLGIDTSMLGKIEKNSRNPSKELISKIAEFYNIEIEELLIAFLSDFVVNKVMEEKELSSSILRLAEKKIENIKNTKLVSQ